jgi:hypothetical protein
MPTELRFLINNDAETPNRYLLNGFHNYRVYGDNGKIGMFNICGAFSGIPLLCPLNSFKE